MRLLLFCLLLALIPAARAQMGFNSPVSVTPATDFEFYARDGFLVQQKYQYAKGVPENSVNTMSCVATAPNLTAAAGILKDPSGDANYTAGISYSCIQTISVPLSLTAQVIGIELTFDDFDTPPQNSSSPTDYINILNENNRVMYVLTGRQIPERHILSGNTICIQFITNNDNNIGRGFQLRWRALVRDNSNDLSNQFRGLRPIAFGKTMKFDTFWGAFSAGFDNQNTGDYSTALGSGNVIGYSAYASLAAGKDNTIERGIENTILLGERNYAAFNVLNSVALGSGNVLGGSYGTAIGTQNTTESIGSIAIGYLNNATGNYSTVMGRDNTASGPSSMAMGKANTASAENATVMGNSNTASGIGATAMGYLNIASGNYSTAMGHRMNTSGQAGAFMIGDTDPLGQGTTGAGAPDQFVARFRNGYYLMTSGTVTRTGVVIGAGQNAWSAISDSTRKERFVAMNHAEVLRKINAMKLSSWNYKGQREIRHYGPMAQDFYAAFGHDALGQVGCDTLINSHDFAGVTFAGVQALIRENEALRVETQSLASRLIEVESQNERLRVETQHLRAETQNFASLQSEMNNRLRLLERALLPRRERVSLRKSKP